MKLALLFSHSFFSHVCIFSSLSLSCVSVHKTFGGFLPMSPSIHPSTPSCCLTGRVWCFCQSDIGSLPRARPQEQWVQFDGSHGSCPFMSLHVPFTKLQPVPCTRRHACVGYSCALKYTQYECKKATLRLDLQEHEEGGAMCARAHTHMHLHSYIHSACLFRYILPDFASKPVVAV